MANGFINFQPTMVHGPVYSYDYETDGSIFVPAGASGAFTAFAGTWTATRNAGGDYSLNLTAAANSPIIACDLAWVFNKIGNDPVFTAVYPNGATRAPAATTSTANGGGGATAAASGVGPIKTNDSYVGHIIRGFMLIKYDVVYSIATADLTTHTGTLFQTTYATGATNTVATKMGATAIGAAQTTNTTVSTITVTTPYIIGANVADVSDFLEINITNPGTSVYKLYGINLYFDYCIL